ncbi:hypothetical protein ACCO45_002496 [Purpureocillium lilacinum]|uniref:Uncharacterized protein n=1 Tax=Purpureocillium lilacinum TaxID=33203 RepID=A0ACC4EB73_PURLI
MVAFGLRLVASLAVSAGVAFAAPPSARLLVDRAQGVLPSKDPWYAVPDGLDAVKPGTILKHRTPPKPIAAFGLLPVNLEAAYQIQYRTTDSLGNATATALTVMVPHSADYTKVLSYQVAEDSATIDCAPSYAFQFDHAKGPDMGTMVTEAELILVEAALEQGWVVIAPDFLGHDGAFLANALAGHATLDGIRAAINSNSFTGISTNPTVTMWGYSGGSLASLWAAELQPTYAPELKIAGAAVGGTVPNITTVVTSINGKGSAGLIPTGVVGLMNQYPELVPVVEQHLLPQYRDEFFKVRGQCLAANSKQFENKDIVGIGANHRGERAGDNWDAADPLFIYKSVNDEISPISETDALVDKWCADGTRIEYQRDKESDHEKLAILAAPKALSWLIDTMNGRNRNTECVTRTVFSSLLDPAAIGVLPKILIDALLDLLGKPVGPLIG